MKTYQYFNNESEVRAYAEKNGIENINDRIESANDGLEYYKPFGEIEGCELAYVMEDGDLYMCFRWRGIAMRADIYYCFDDKTYALRLCEETDWQGISGFRNSVSKGDVPQKVGKPTAKKLDAWRAYLLDLRRREEEQRDRVFACMVAKIVEVKKSFPEAKSVKWQNGYWNFEKVSNGLKYTVNISQYGEIYENLDFTSHQQHYNIGTAEKAARMMHNGMESVKPIDKNCCNPFQVQIDTYEAYVSNFMGGRPF